MADVVNRKFQPLENVIGGIACSDFMYMGTRDAGDTQIFLYKHINNRRYLNVDAAGNYYKYNAQTNNYDPCTQEEAFTRIENVVTPLTVEKS